MSLGQPDHRGVDLRLLKIWLPVFFCFAVVVALTSGGADGIWGAWAALGYGTAYLAVWISHRPAPPLLLACIGALVIPAVRPVLAGPATADMSVLVNSAHLLLRHGIPYLPAGNLASWRSYDPYLPAMALFGLPRAIGLPGVLGDPRSWLVVVSAAALVMAFVLARPHGAARCRACFGSALGKAAFVVASPLLAMSLSLGITDPPVTALVCLALACSVRAAVVSSPPDLAPLARSARGPGAWTLFAGLAVGTACAMKATAWPAFAVIAAMFVARDGARRAARFIVSSVATAAVLIVVTAPRLVADPRALFENTVVFPLGLANHRTPAASPLPGHLLAGAGYAGHLAAVGLLLAAGLTVAASLVIWPPMDLRAATVRLCIALVLLFALAPEARFGYFAYPAALLVWLGLSGQPLMALRESGQDSTIGHRSSRLARRAGA